MWNFVLLKFQKLIIFALTTHKTKMTRRFNTTGTCRPKDHYMVDITERVEIIRKMISQGDYFCINRGRQYGKTTTLRAISMGLKDEYTIFSISLEGVEEDCFKDLKTLFAKFVNLVLKSITLNLEAEVETEVREILSSFAKDHKETCTSDELETLIFDICTHNSKPIVLLIDEVDQASNYICFTQFLGFLRSLYLKREWSATFQSVILAGVYDIKNLKLKIRPEEQHLYNSPWNIAAPFDVDMSLSADGIAGMLADYKADNNLDFDEAEIAHIIRDYTSGYPYLVSRICQIVDTQKWDWNKECVLMAINKILNEGSTLFDDIVKKLDQFPSLVNTIKGILFNGNVYPLNYYDMATNLALMFNFIKQTGNTFAVSCRMFETWFYNFFLSQAMTTPLFQQGAYDKNQFVHDGIIDMPRLLERFAVHVSQTFSLDKDHRFLEENGREIFLTYLRPIINGIGNYYIEAQTRDHDRMDVVIDYLGKQYVVELKIWRGNAYNERGKDQLLRYLEYFNLKTGYLLSFSFNNKKDTGLKEPVDIDGRTLIEAVV